MRPGGSLSLKEHQSEEQRTAGLKNKLWAKICAFCLPNTQRIKRAQLSTE